ncbi:MAG: 50S ribosomal protein L15 [Deltaproteobacteria bacterium RBG_13_43_22]|nr:MAG: 50S ribosomal protein L15 [Deltaproteobacteria bacterium RBG_13_43_22]
MDSESKGIKYHLGNLSPAPGSRTKPKRIGRGIGSGHGKTATRGMKGQKSRSGGGVRPGFEGGQMPIQRRLPKRGFTPIHKTSYTLINIRDLKSFPGGSTVDVPALIQSGVIRHLKEAVKLLGHGEIQTPLFVKVNKCSQGARQKIESAGGTVEVI